MQILNMKDLIPTQLTQAAQILTDSFAPIAWPTLPAAMAEIEKRLVPENTLLAAVEDGIVLGWGGILAPDYHGNVIELHPLCVRADKRRQGIARAVVTALEDEARARGALVIWLGADDERPGGETSLANLDLFDDLPKRLAEFNSGTHQTAFYLKLGYRIIGVMPEADGVGKPDIYMGKRL